MSDGTVRIFTGTEKDFAGEQFILMWDRGSARGGGIQGLAFFLNPIYTAPTGSNVQVIYTTKDLEDFLASYSTSSPIDTLDIEGTEGTAVAVGGTGDQALAVPGGVYNIYLGPDAWLQGKLNFHSTASVKHHLRTISGPGVLDVSRFEYDLRSCGTDQGYDALSVPAGFSLDNFDLEGIIISDTNHAATDPLFSSTVKNVKTISWNGVNAGLKIEDNTTASNVFVRSGDDSLMVWGSNITVTNATVWQNYNGGVVNLGWSNNSTGDACLIDGLYVVKTDWFTPTAPTFTMGPGFTLNDQNNAVIASMMVPGTTFGVTQPSLYKNIFVEDPPQVLFSLKILPPDCDLTSFDAGCPVPVDLTQQSVLNLNVENLFTPPSIEENSIGFQTLLDYPNSGPLLPYMYTLTGSMNIRLTNVFVVGKVVTNGDDVNVKYSVGPF
jgi:hypothetical protein